MSTNSEIRTERAVVNVTDKLQIQEIIDNATNVAQNAKRATDKLCKQLSEIEDALGEILEKYCLTDSLEEFDYKGFGLRYCGSRQSESIHIVETDRCLLLPWYAAEVGKGFYYAGDFNAWYENMDRHLVLDFAQGLKEFLENFNDKLVKIAKEAEIEIPKISIS